MEVPPASFRRKILNMAVASILLELGYDTADKIVLETLSEMLQCCKL